MPISPFEEIIGFAIDKEREARLFYEDLARKVDHPVMKETLLAMAGEEERHAGLLRGLTPKNVVLSAGPSQPDMKISNYLEDVAPSDDMTYQEILIIAMKREEKACSLYGDLEARAADDATRRLFGLLKGEELKHKARLEREYEERVLWEG